MTIELALRIATMGDNALWRLIADTSAVTGGSPDHLREAALDALATAYEAQAKELATLKGLVQASYADWNSIRTFCEDRMDIVDGSDGPKPDDYMRVLNEMERLRPNLGGRP